MRGDFFDDIENIDIDTIDVFPEHWDMSFEIHVWSDECIPDYHLIPKLISRNINACVFRDSEISGYEITENCAYIEELPAKRLQCYMEYKKTFFVNFNGVFNSIKDAVELLSAVIYEFTSYETSLEILFWKNNTHHSLFVTKYTLFIFRKNKPLSVDKKLSPTHTKIILDIIEIVRTILDDCCVVKYNEMCYLLNTYIICAAISKPVLKMHRLLLETEDWLPDNSTLHGYSTLDIQNIPCSWRDENTSIIANSCDPSKNYHSPMTDKAINMSVIEQLLFNTPKDILVTISLNNIQKSASPERKRVKDEYWWHEVYEMNDTDGVCIVDSNKDIDQPQLVNEFLKNYKSEIRHSRKMERQLQMFHNSKKNTAGVVLDLCVYYSKFCDKLALVTLGLYGNADRIYNLKNQLFHITNPRG